MTDATEVLLLCLIPALVFALSAYYINRQAARKADAAVGESSESLVSLPKFTADFDMMIEFDGKRYRVYFAVADVQMVRE